MEKIFQYCSEKANDWWHVDLSLQIQISLFSLVLDDNLHFETISRHLFVDLDMFR